MRFLCDQDVYGITVDRLLELGHDVVTVKEVGFTEASDRLVLQRAHTERRILITRDKDFGQLVFLRRRPTSGVVLLRVTPKSERQVHGILQDVLNRHSTEELRNRFVTVEPHGARIRNIPT